MRRDGTDESPTGRAALFSHPQLKTVARNAGSLLAGLAGQRTGTLLAAILLARGLSTGSFGLYIFILSLIEIAIIAVSLGSQTIVVRQVAQGGRLSEIYGNALGLRALCALAVYPLLVLAASLFQREHLAALTAVMGLGMVANSLAEVPLGILMGKRDMTLKASVDGFVSAAGVILVWAALRMDLGLEGAVWAYALRGGINLSASSLACRLRRRALPGRVAWTGITALLRETLPLSADSMAAALYTRVTPILLLAWISDAAAGLYGGAFRIFEIVTMAGTVAARAAFPTMARTVEKEGGRRGGPLLPLLMGATLLCAVPFVTVVAPMAGTILSVLLGEPYREAAPILMVLMAAVPLIFVYEIAIHHLYAVGRQLEVMLVGLFGIAASLALNTILISRFQLAGAAFAVLATEAAIFGAYFILCRTERVRSIRNGAMVFSLLALGAALADPHPTGLVAWAGGGLMMALLVILIMKRTEAGSRDSSRESPGC